MQQVGITVNKNITGTKYNRKVSNSKFIYKRGLKDQFVIEVVLMLFLNF